MARCWFTKIDPRPAPARFCVFKPISHFSTDEQPELVTFFARGEVLTGLCNKESTVAEMLLNEAQKGEYGSLIIGRRGGLARVRRRIFGSVSERLLNELSECSFAIVG